RANLEAENRLQQRGRKFLHLSRHNHAMRRPRGPGGRFLTAAEIAAMQDKDRSDDYDGQHGDSTSAGYDNNQAAAYQVQHHRQQLKQEEELFQQQQQQKLQHQHQQQQQQQYHQRQAYETGV
ncbi:Transcriptional activator, partial [Mortierella sp. AD010]